MTLSNKLFSGRTHDESKLADMPHMENLKNSKRFEREESLTRGMDHNSNSLVITAEVRDKAALDFEVQVEKRRHSKNEMGALLELQNSLQQKALMREKLDFIDDDGETDDTFNTAELDLSLNFKGLTFAQVSYLICQLAMYQQLLSSLSPLALFGMFVSQM